MSRASCPGSSLYPLPSIWDIQLAQSWQKWMKSTKSKQEGNGEMPHFTSSKILAILPREPICHFYAPKIYDLGACSHCPVCLSVCLWQTFTSLITRNFIFDKLVCIYIRSYLTQICKFHKVRSKAKVTEVKLWNFEIDWKCLLARLLLGAYLFHKHILFTII